MHFVAALDAVPEMRGVLGLFEGVATGAADGYGRIAGKPAATLLHLGPGLTNGLASLHNARRARTPIVNIVGDHASYHKRYDAPLESDIEAVAESVSGGCVAAPAPPSVGADAAAAITAALQSAGPRRDADPPRRRRPGATAARSPALRPRRAPAAASTPRSPRSPTWCAAANLRRS